MSKKTKKETLQCVQCETHREKDSNFYNTKNKIYKNIGKIPVCKTCIKKLVDENNMDSVYNFLRQFDIRFDIEYWEKAVESNLNTFGKYMTMVNSLPQFENTTWKHSVFEKSSKKDESSTPVDIINDEEEFILTSSIVKKWGTGYCKEEYIAFEYKYAMLKNNYQEKTAMHTEALLTYIRYRVKEELATASGDSKSAKEWGTLAKDAATAAKINPSQLSKSDLSDGLDTFGQLVRTVEQAVDIIPILPQFKEKPQDKVDFTIWCYINYIRDLKGLPLAEYHEIYQFYEERKKAYENREDL